MHYFSTPDYLLLVAQFVCAFLYALILEFVWTRKRYERNGLMVVTVILGTAMVGFLVGMRFILDPVPNLAPIDLTWWQWQLWTLSFVAAGIPITAWQVIVYRAYWTDFVHWARGE